MPNSTQPMNEEELKKAIEYIFGYDEEETTRGELNSFNRHPEYVSIQDITKKHTTGKSYHAIEKQLLELMQNDRDAAIREAQAQGYIDGVNSDKRSIAVVANKTTIKSLEAIKMYAIDCTFGKGFESIHHEKAIPLKSIDSRIEYYKSLQSQPNAKEGE